MCVRFLHETGVLVPVMLVVDVPMVMLEALVDVEVSVILTEEHGHPSRHDGCREHFADPEYLSEKRHGDRGAHEGCRRKEGGRVSKAEETHQEMTIFPIGTPSSWAHAHI